MFELGELLPEFFESLLLLSDSNTNRTIQCAHCEYFKFGVWNWVYKSSNIEKPLFERLLVFCRLKVHPTGEMSNFLLEDFQAVMKFMNAENQKNSNYN